MCNDCVNLTLTVEDLTQQLMGLRRSNQTLRTVNGTLRRRITALQDQADSIFLAWCEEFDNTTSNG